MQKAKICATILFMNIQQMHKKLASIPHMSPKQAEYITKFIQDNNIKNVLELGFCHGVSSCYIASALEAADGKLVTIDLKCAKYHNPNIETLSKMLGLENRMEIYYEPTSYTWRLMRFLEKKPIPKFDLCYIDGAHSWFVDGFAFFLVDRLLNPGGYIIFDDINWTYLMSPSLRKTQMVKEMPWDEKCCRQVKKVFDLLVKTDPRYGEFETWHHWAIAKKLKA